MNTQINNLQNELNHILETKNEVHKYDLLTMELNELKNEHHMIYTKYSNLLAEQNLVNGHQNKKQKIHYIDTLKQQINELIEENKRLRNL